MMHTSNHPRDELRVARQKLPPATQTNRPQVARQLHTPQARQVQAWAPQNTWPAVTQRRASPQVKLGERLRVARKPEQPVAAHWPRVARQHPRQSPTHENLAERPRVARELATQPAAFSWLRVAQQHPPQGLIGKNLKARLRVARKLAYQPAAASQPWIAQRHPTQH